MAIYYSAAFKRQVKRLVQRYPKIRDDIQPTINALESGKTPGNRIQGTGCVLYKVRIKNTSAARGKSGGYRIIYYLQTANDVLLVTIYSKSEQSDITTSELLSIIKEE